MTSHKLSFVIMVSYLSKMVIDLGFLVDYNGHRKVLQENVVKNEKVQITEVVIYYKKLKSIAILSKKH